LLQFYRNIKVITVAAVKAGNQTGFRLIILDDDPPHASAGRIISDIGVGRDLLDLASLPFSDRPVRLRK
jgi:hypothetical protein